MSRKLRELAPDARGIQEAGSRNFGQACLTIPAFKISVPLSISTHLVTRADLQFEEDRKVKVRGGPHDERVGEHEGAVLRAEDVHLGGRAQEGDGRHEAGHEGHRHGQGAHTAAAQQELWLLSIQCFCGILTNTSSLKMAAMS